MDRFAATAASFRNTKASSAALAGTLSKSLWGSDWDELFARDESGLLLKRMEECVDGEYQNFKARGGAYVRKEFFGKYPELLKLVEDKSDDDLARLRRGGHDPVKVYNAFQARERDQRANPPSSW